MFDYSLQYKGGVSHLIALLEFQQGYGPATCLVLAGNHLAIRGEKEIIFRMHALFCFSGMNKLC